MQLKLGFVVIVIVIVVETLLAGHMNTRANNFENSLKSLQFYCSWFGGLVYRRKRFGNNWKQNTGTRKGTTCFRYFEVTLAIICDTVRPVAAKFI